MTLSAALLIAACGGGGNGLDTTQNAPSALAISGNNAEAAAKASYEAALGSGDLADLGGSIGISAAAPGGFSKASSGAQVSGFLAGVMQKIPFGPDVFPCAVSGTVTISGNIENPLTLTAGDNFAVVSEACDDGLGEIVDGSLSFTVTEFSGDVLTGLYRVSMDTVVDNLQVATAEDTISSRGDALITLDTIEAPFVMASVSGSLMTTDSNASSETLSNYSSTQTLDAGANLPLFTMIAQGTLQTSGLSGSVSYTTPLMFEGIGQNYPHTGELLISGDRSSARLIAVDEVNVRIEVDSNGDGSIDETINTTWVDLTAPG
ncbi:MAG: hypothetical protein GY783_00815 [Gammaproteobacteria bacterium]|nr:hypothetical protein [Gammaproteobacteria bacterium]